MSKVIPSLISTNLIVQKTGDTSTTNWSTSSANSKVNYTTAGETSITVPTGALQMIIKCWGAAGGGSRETGGTTYTGGAGGYATSTISCTPGDTYIVTVGAGGQGISSTGDLIANGGNNNTNNGSGGNGHNGSGQLFGDGGGGQYSAVHHFTKSKYILKVCAGGGGGASSGAMGGDGGSVRGYLSDGNQSQLGGFGGNNGVGGAGVGDGSRPTQSYSAGTNYVSNATTTGSSAMNLNAGIGGSADPTYSSIGAGGGGGYGGGGAGISSAGGGGGGSYGDTIIAATNNIFTRTSTVANSSDTDRINNYGQANLNASGNQGLVVIYFSGFQTILSTPNLTGASTNVKMQLYKAIETRSITVNQSDSNSAGLSLTPSYSAATASTLIVSRHNYITLDDISTSVTGGGTLNVTDSAVMKFNANAGTHKALDTGTTKTTPSTVDTWVKVNVNGTIMYMPLYASKTT